jgi:hypothetical protein
MTETSEQAQDRQQAIDITSIQKDIEFMKDSMDRNFKDHTEIKAMFASALKDKVTVSRFRPIETIGYALAGGSLMWLLTQVLQTVKAFS